ncbi:MAG: geranylgeranyl reductase family protein [Candidatus Korarchaeum sp.]|nr:geranylgeranyl reductase family protein [Candidatus Korarchaeum sp.]MDW8036198.1 geranylgeranyl reductase family protein [Candidatus Korarchaeum sp.]
MWDVIVVGAGPSGSTSTYLSAKKGYKTLILDMKGFPRHKTCGGGVTWRAYDFLRSLGISIQSFEAYHREVLIRGFGEEVRVSSNSGEFAVATVERRRFDKELLDIAISQGAEFKRLKVTGIIQKEDRVELSGIGIQAKYLIGADGAYSLTASSSDIRSCWSDEDLIFAIEGKAPLYDELTFLVDVSPSGYGWIFPRGSDSNAGVGGMVPKSKEIMKAFKRFSKVYSVERVGAWIIPTGGHDRPIAKGRVLLVGDAAGLADPLTGEGLYYAFKSAHECVNSLESEDPVSSYYERMKDVLEELRLKRRARNIIVPRMSFFFRIFASYPEIARRYMLTSIGKLDFREFWRWGLLRIPRATLSMILRSLR